MLTCMVSIAARPSNPAVTPQWCRNNIRKGVSYKTSNATHFNLSVHQQVKGAMSKLSQWTIPKCIYVVVSLLQATFRSPHRPPFHAL